MNIYNNFDNFSFIPLHKKSKKPSQMGWQNRGAPFSELASLGGVPADINVGILTGAASDGLLDVDLDGPRTIEAGALILDYTGMVAGRDSRPRSHWFYRTTDRAQTVKFLHPADGRVLVELRGDGSQTMMPPSIHPDDGETVRFEPGKDGEPTLCDRETLLHKIGLVAVVSVLADHWVEGGRHDLAFWFAGLCACNGVSRDACETVVQVLSAIMDDDEPDDRLKAVETTFARVSDSQPVEWRSKLESRLGSEKAVRTVIEWMGGTVAQSNEIDNNKIKRHINDDTYRTATKLETDIEVTEWFQSYIGDRIIYSDRENQFYSKNTGVYEAISPALAKKDVTDFLKNVVSNRGAADQASRRSVESLSKINAVLEISKSYLRTDDRSFDKDDHLIGTENGVFDLSTFRLVHTNDILTKRIGTKYIAGADCPSFLEFLDQVLDSDVDKISYLQRALGYTLTGSVEAQIMFILTGKGANGKSVLLKLIAALMGTYSAAIPSHSITQQKFGNDKTDDLASLVGKRFVVASEGDAGDRLAVAKIKRMVAGDPISVRKLYGTYFDLQPKFKLWFGSNELPQVSGTDYAIWRRIHVIEFPRTFEPHERDPKLLEKLKVELPGIFNWALEGLREIGTMTGDFLAPPPSVVQSVNEYKAENDNISKFIDDRCIRDPNGFVTMGDLYSSYKAWCFENAVEPISNNMLGKELTNLDFKIWKKNTGNGRKGLRLR